MLRKTSVSMFWCQKLLNTHFMFINHSSYYANSFFFCSLTYNYTIMQIYNYVCYCNPLGEFVEDFVTDSELEKLFDRHVCHRYDYKLRGNFRYVPDACHLHLEFVYFVLYSAYSCVNYETR